MKAENRKYKVTHYDGTKEEIIGTQNLPPQSQVRSIRLIKEKQPPQNAKNASARLSERQYIVKYHDGTETLITGFHNLPDRTAVAAIHRVREEHAKELQTASDYLCFADFEYTCGGMAEDTDFDVTYGQEILSVGIVIANRHTTEILDSFYRTIRPAHNPQLTGFCKNLTGLTQEEIDASDDFETVMKQATQFCKQYDFTQIYVFGDTDRQMLLKDQKRHNAVPGLNAFISQLQSVDNYLSNQLFRTSLAIGLEKLKHICGLDEPVQHHALADAKDLCSVYFHISAGQYDQSLAQQYQAERINRAEYYRNRQFLSIRPPGRHGFDDAVQNAQKENAITSALDVIAYLKELNYLQPYVADLKLTAFCDDLLALLGAPEEHFAVQKNHKER